MTELLLPAGNLKKLKTAIHFGADAVYLGGKNFSLRAFADNFSEEDIRAGIEYAHAHDKKVYVTANIYAKNSDIAAAKEYFAMLADAKADGVLISDMGLFRVLQEFPTLPVHISTQANTQNVEAVRFYRDLGAQRVVLARELSLEEIALIHAEVPDIELEVFVHGAMCMSMSGRCILSSYFTSRSANRGECTQPCRWGYRLMETGNHKEMPLDLEQDERGSYLLNSKDLRLIGRLPELIEAGVTSFKVEGRMKSELYVATVAAAYRTAIDEYCEYGKIISLEALLNQLEEVSHRPYTEAFFEGDNPDTFSPDISRTEETAIFIANVLNCEDGIVTVEMRNRFKSGDLLTVLSPDDNNGKTFTVPDIYLDGEMTNDAKLVQSIYTFACPYALKTGDLLIKK